MQNPKWKKDLSALALENGLTLLGVEKNQAVLADPISQTRTLVSANGSNPDHIIIVAKSQLAHALQHRHHFSGLRLHPRAIVDISDEMSAWLHATIYELNVEHFESAVTLTNKRDDLLYGSEQFLGSYELPFVAVHISQNVVLPLDFSEILGGMQTLIRADTIYSAPMVTLNQEQFRLWRYRGFPLPAKTEPGFSRFRLWKVTEITIKNKLEKSSERFVKYWPRQSLLPFTLIKVI